MPISRSVLCLLLVLPFGAPHAATETHASIDAQFHANAQKHGIPAQSLLVLRNGEVLYRNAAGTAEPDGGAPVTLDTVFPVFSVGKLFASTLVLQLVDEGLLDLTAPASRYLPSLPKAWSEVRLDQLLSHVSGLPEYYDITDFTRPFPPTRDAAIAALDEVPPPNSPGERTHYNQTGYLVIAAVLEAVTGTPYPKLVRQRILQPLGMEQTWLEQNAVPEGRLVQTYRGEDGDYVREGPFNWPDYALAHVGGYLTLDDMGTFMSAVAQGRLVPKSRLLEAWQPYRFDNGKVGFFATGWDYCENGRWREVGHDGGTKLRVRIVFDDNLDEHFVIVYLTNGNKDGVWSGTLVESIQRLVLPE